MLKFDDRKELVADAVGRLKAQVIFFPKISRDTDAEEKLKAERKVKKTEKKLKKLLKKVDRLSVLQETQKNPSDQQLRLNPTPLEWVEETLGMIGNLTIEEKDEIRTSFLNRGGQGLATTTEVSDLFGEITAEAMAKNPTNVHVPGSLQVGHKTTYKGIDVLVPSVVTKELNADIDGEKIVLEREVAYRDEVSKELNAEKAPDTAMAVAMAEAKPLTTKAKRKTAQ